MTIRNGCATWRGPLRHLQTQAGRNVQYGPLQPWGRGEGGGDFVDSNFLENQVVRAVGEWIYYGETMGVLCAGQDVFEKVINR